MIRLLAFGLIVVASTLMGGVAASLIGGASSGSAASQHEAELDFVRLEPSSVPVIRRGKLVGYVVARATITATTDDVKKNKLMLSLYAAEAVFTAIHEDEGFDFSALRPMQIAAVNARVVKIANERIGRAALKSSLIENLSFVAPDEVRCVAN